MAFTDTDLLERAADGAAHDPEVILAPDAYPWLTRLFTIIHTLWRL